MNKYLSAVASAATALGTGIIAATKARRELQRQMILAVVEGELTLEQVKDTARDALHKVFETNKVKDDDDHKRLVNSIDQTISRASQLIKQWDKMSPQLQSSVKRGTTLVSGALAKIKEAETKAAEEAKAEDDSAPDAPDAPDAPKQEQEQEQEQDERPVAARMADELRAYIEETPVSEMDSETQDALAKLYVAMTQAQAQAQDLSEAA